MKQKPCSRASRLQRGPQTLVRGDAARDDERAAARRGQRAH